MDFRRARKARSGVDFLAYGTGDVRIKTIGDQDEDVDIDDGDTRLAPSIDAAVAGVSGGAGTGVKSRAGSTVAPRVGGANVVSSTSSHGRRDLRTAGSQASIERQSLLQPDAGEDASKMHGDDGPVPKASVEGFSRRLRASEYRKQYSKNKKLSSGQTLSKRKGLETGPSTSMPTKRIKLLGNPSDPGVMAGDQNKAKEVQPRDFALSTRIEDLPLKRKEIIKDGGEEGREKSLGPGEMVREKRRVLLLGDESDEDMLDQDEARASPKYDGNEMKLFGFGTPRRPGSGKKVLGKQLSIPSDENCPRKWITCTECQKRRSVYADEDVKASSWCCEMNTRNPKYASCSVPEELNDPCKGEDVHSSELEMLSARDGRKEGQGILVQTNQLAKEKAQRNMVWVKIDGMELWWPGLMVTVVPPATQRKIDVALDTPKAVRLFHPRKDVEEYQVAKRSSLKPFYLCPHYKDRSSHPDFIVAVNEAEQYYFQPNIHMEGFSELANSSKEGARLSDANNYVRCLESSREIAGSNDLVLEDVEKPEDDPSQVQGEDEIESVEDGEVNQAPVEMGTGDISPDAGNGSGLSERRDDLQFSQPNANKEGGVVEDEEVLQVSVEQEKSEDSLGAARAGVSSSRDDGRQCRPSHCDQMENRMPDSRVVVCSAIGASEQGNVQNSPEGNGFDESDKQDDVSSSTMNDVEGRTKFQRDAKLSEDMEVSERTKASEASGFEESGEALVLDLQIQPTRKMVGYEESLKELVFEGGLAVSIDPVSLGKEFHKCYTGLSPHKCIHYIGKSNVRNRFPESARSRDGLKLDALDPNDSFAMLLRDTWLREYKDEPMPEYLKMRFVAACIVEERGEPVNWAIELSNSVRAELRQYYANTRESLSTGVLNLIINLLDKQVDRAPPVAAPLPSFEAVKEEEGVDFAEYDHCCYQCKHGGELLCCDGKGCRKTYHLQCLDPPLEEVPESTFLCPSCLANASTLPCVQGGTRSVVEDGIELHTDATFRPEPQGVAESSTFVGEIDALECRASVDSRTNLEACTTKELASELPRSESDEVYCIRTANNLDKDAACASPDTNAYENEHTAHENEHTAHENEHTAHENERTAHVIGDGNMRQMDPEATVGDCQMKSSPRLVLDSLMGKEHVLSIDSVHSDLEEGEISPSEQANTVQVDISASELPCSSTPPLTQEVLARFDLPYEENEFPSSDDHNSICEGCDVGGELMLCDGRGCKVVYHKECLDPPLQTVPAGVWYCPGCETRKVEKIWSVRSGYESSNRSGSAAAKGSDTSSPDSDSEDEAQDDVPLDARLRSSQQRPDGEVAATTSGTLAGFTNTALKRDGVEYLVQWKFRSHAHDKWVSENELEKLAPKELARFKRLLQLGQVKYDSEWAEPERVIQKRVTRVSRRQPVEEGNISKHNNAEIEWFVKWKGLGYENCTWEPAGAGVLATSKGIELINGYERWTDAAKQRTRKESLEEARCMVQGPLRALKCQPEWMIRPEQEQLDAFYKLLKMWHARTNGIIVYEASQEKIVMTIMFLLSLVEHYRVVHPVLVVVPKSLIQNWEHELYKWASKLYIVNYASKLEEARDIIRRAEFSSFSEPFKPQIVLTTFDVITCDTDHLKKVEWEVLIIDESRSQRVQKSCQKSYRPLSQINATFRLLLLNEPLKSNVEELIQFVNFLDPRKSVLPNGDESTQVAELRRRLIGRVFEYIPKNRLTEYWVPVEMTPVQLDQYYNFLVRHYPTLSRSHRDHQIQEVVTKLRQSCNHPFLADPSLEGTTGQGLTPEGLLDHHIQISGKMQLLHLMMPILKAAGWRVLIFSQETKQLNILERYMTQSHGSDSYERVDHDIAVNAKEAALQRFNAEGSKRCVLLLKTGMHVSFKNVQFVLIYDSDWNPENDMRALHKIHNEGEAGSKPLPVLRLYTHLTVEESTLALSRDEQLPSASFSAKICQKLLAWGASAIFERFDSSKGLVGSLYRPKGAKVGPKAKLKQAVYNSEVVSKLLDALLSQDEVSSKLDDDQLLECLLVPRDESAPLFAESDHPMNMITGDSAQAFWRSFLKWRHDEWQSKKGNMLGKGRRGRKRITYDEDAMASAAFSKAQILEESERKRPRRRKASNEEAQGAITAPSDPVSAQQGHPSASSILHSDNVPLETAPHVDTVLLGDSNFPATSTQMDSVLPSVITSPLPSTQVDSALTSAIPDGEQVLENTDPVSVQQGLPPLSSSAHSDVFLPVSSTVVNNASDIPEREHLQEKTLSSPSHQSEVARSAQGSLNNDHAPNQSGSSERNRSGASTMLPCAAYWEFLSKISAMLNLPGPARERAIEIFSYFYRTQKQIRKPRPHHEIFAIQLCVVWLAAEQFSHAIDKMKSVYMVEKRLGVSYPQRVQVIGDLYEKVKEQCSNFRPRPPSPVAVPTSTQPALVPEITSPRTPLLNHPPAAEIEPSPGNVHLQAVNAEEPAHNLPEGTSLPVETPQVQVEVLLPGSQSVQVTLPVDNAPEVEGAHEVVEPVVVEADTEVVFVEADPRLVPEEPLDKFTSQNQVPENEPIEVPSGTLTSGDSSLEQGLGWVLVSPAPDVPLGDPPGSELPLEAIGSERVSNSESHIDTSQGDETGPSSATLAAITAEMPPQVPPTEPTQPAIQNEEASLASLKDRLYQDRNFVINVQFKEMHHMKFTADRKLQVLKKNYDESRVGSSPAPGTVDESERQYKQDRKILERTNLADTKALESRQRAHRDKLNDLYSKLISRASGSGVDLDVGNIEEEIHKIKEFYIIFTQASVDQRAGSRSTPSGTFAPEALPMTSVQADSSSRVAQSPAIAAENEQRQLVGRSTVSSVPAILLQPGHVTQSVTHSQRPAAVSTAMMPPSSTQRVAGLTQRPASLSPAAAMQPCGVQTRAQLQRRNAIAHVSPTPSGPRGAPAVSLSTPAVATPIPPRVGSMARPSTSALGGALGGNVTGLPKPDVLLKEKEKLNKELEKAKTAYESESQKIKAEYDREAEMLHKKYESLLVEQHRSFTKRQQEVQQNIVKVEWNRKLAEALKLREELAARAAVFAGLATQTAVQPLANQQTFQQMSGRPRTSGVPVHANISRGTANTVNVGSGISLQPLGTSSTRVSTAPFHHSPRYGLPVAPQNEHARSSMSEAMAVLAASGNADLPGIPATGTSQPQMETFPLEMNVDVAAASQARSSPGATSPSLQDPILAIIRESVPSIEDNPPSPWGPANPNPQFPEPTNPSTLRIGTSTQYSQPPPPEIAVQAVPMLSPSAASQEQVANVVFPANIQNLIVLSDSDDG